MTQQPAIYVPQLPAEALALQVPDAGRKVDNLWRIVWRRRWQCLSVFTFVDCKTGISILAAGAANPEPQNVLRSQCLIDAIDTWRAAYDFILIDSPPVLPISDARILVPLSDYCIFVTHWRKTRWTAAMHALRLLRESGARLAVVVISKVHVKQLSTYEFADSEMYGRAYHRHYGRMRGGEE